MFTGLAEAFLLSVSRGWMSGVEGGGKSPKSRTRAGVGLISVAWLLFHVILYGQTGYLQHSFMHFSVARNIDGR